MFNPTKQQPGVRVPPYPPTLNTPQDQIQQADEVNRIPLPAIPDRFGVRLPPFEYQTTLPNLQWGAEEEPARDGDKPIGVSLSLPGPPSR